MIELVQLTKRYGAIVAVDALSIAVEPGELVVLLGASGCGKTTTLKMVNRLVEPDGGTVRLDGEDVRSVPAHALRRQIGYCFQRIGLFPHMTVAENVGITPRLLGWDVAAIELRVDELLELVELEPASIRSR
ncbi:MAG: ATP-binding cassette domain-containing protein, partial [Planctomycetes bacterium]|nr:ATP-binding cassette domain-containing protein [Planctomycetota bacterium]